MFKKAFEITTATAAPIAPHFGIRVTHITQFIIKDINANAHNSLYRLADIITATLGAKM